MYMLGANTREGSATAEDADLQMFHPLAGSGFRNPGGWLTLLGSTRRYASRRQGNDRMNTRVVSINIPFVSMNIPFVGSLRERYFSDALPLSNLPPTVCSVSP